MKISGYSDQGLPIEQVVSVDLAEVTLSVTPDEARKVAAFLIHAAAEMDRMESAYGHMHLADKQPGFDDSPHLTVFNSELEG
jgi:hypothetical protein